MYIISILNSTTHYYCERVSGKQYQTRYVQNSCISCLVFFLSPHNQISSPSTVSRLPAHARPGLGQHVWLHSSVHSDGRAPGPEWRTRRGRVLQGPSPTLCCSGDSGHHVSWDHQLYWGSGGRCLQHLRGETDSEDSKKYNRLITIAKKSCSLDRSFMSCLTSWP